MPRGVVVARDLVEVARAPDTTHPPSRQAMMHQAMSSQLTEQTRMFTRCHLLTSLKTQQRNLKHTFRQGAASDSGDDNIAMLEKAIPGVPGEDYPIYAEVPESGFTCDGQVDGGYYADPEAECQVFHICTADGAGGLAQYSFLCPNGTLFNQNYFICDWWFNFDCSTAEDLYSLNDEIAAERDALASDGLGTYGGQPEYGAPAEYSGDAPVYETGAPLRRGRGRRLGGGRRNGRRSSQGRRAGRRG